MAGEVEAVALDTVPEWMDGVLEGLSDEMGDTPSCDVRRLLGSSNELLELIFDEDRTLMVKRGRHEWVQSMFDTAQAASDLLHSRTDLTAPRPLPVARTAAEPLQAYWRIPLPTLGELWPAMDAPEREESLRSVGRLLRQAHHVELTGWGDLLHPESGKGGLERYLRRDLGDRLLPAVYAKWSVGAWPLEQLIESIPAVAERVDSKGGVLSHSDVHIQNVLCRRVDGAVRAVGLLDLDNARALPPEADVASFQVLHGPLFNQSLDEKERAAVTEGYGGSLDPFVLRFFRAAHLCNLGFHSGLVGDTLHAGWVADAFSEEVEALRTRLDQSAES